MCRNTITRPLFGLLCLMSHGCYCFAPSSKEFRNTHPLQRKVQPLPRSDAFRRFVTNEFTETRQINRGDAKRKMIAWFRSYLGSLSRNIQNKRSCAHKMDMELRNMENRWYQSENDVSKDDDIANVISGLNPGNFRGPALEPDTSCYAMVIEAYAGADMGVEGAEMATKVFDRFLAHDSKQRATITLFTSLIKAWANADDFEQARRWLHRAEELYLASRDPLLEPDQYAYSSYLHRLSQSTNLTAVEIGNEAKRMLEHMDRLANEEGVVGARTNAVSCTAAIRCVAHLGDYREVKKIFEMLKQRYQDAPNDQKHELKPNVKVYSVTANAYANGMQGIEAAYEAEALLRELRQTYDATQDQAFKPNGFLYSSILKAYARVDSKAEALAAVERADALLKEYEEVEGLCHNSASYVYSAAIQVRANRHNPHGAEKAEDLLRRMPFFDSVAFETVITAYATRNQVREMQEILDEMRTLVASKQLKPPRHQTYSTCVNAWVRQLPSLTDAIDEADRVVRLLIADHSKRGHTQKKIIFVCNNVIEAWRDSRRAEAGERAESLVSAMVEAFHKSGGNKMFAPGLGTFSLVFQAWRESGAPDTGSRALKLLERMEKPDLNPLLRPLGIIVLLDALKCLCRDTSDGMSQSIDSLFERICQRKEHSPRMITSVLSEFRSSKGMSGAERAEAFLRKVQAMSGTDGLEYLRPSRIPYSCILHKYFEEGRMDDVERLLKEMAAEGDSTRPDMTTYNKLITSLMASEDRKAFDRAVGFLEMVLRGFEEGDEKFVPDKTFHVSTLTAICRANHTSPAMGELIFGLGNTMRETGVIPQCEAAFSAFCLACLKHCGLEEMKTLKQMVFDIESEQDSGEGPPLSKPSYTQVLTALTYCAEPGGKKLAMDLLQHLHERAQAGKCTFEVDRCIYHVLLAGWARSGDRDSVQQATFLLGKMVASNDEVLKPVARSYDWVMLAAANAKTSSQDEKDHNFARASSVFTTVHKTDNLDPTSNTYVAYLLASAKLQGESEVREKTARTVLQLCINNGLVSRSLLRVATVHFAPILKDLLAAEGATTVPSRWHKNLIRRSDWSRRMPFFSFSQIRRDDESGVVRNG